MSTLLEQWRDTAYSKEMDKASLQKFWGTYFQTEKEIYEKLLENPAGLFYSRSEVVFKRFCNKRLSA